MSRRGVLTHELSPRNRPFLPRFAHFQYAMFVSSHNSAPSPTTPSASKVIHDARRSLPSPKSRRSTSSGLRTLFGLRQSQSSLSTNHKQIAAYRPTLNKQDDGPACRIYGSVEVKKVMANLHVTTLGHGYQSWEHTGHDSEYSSKP